MGGAGSPAPVSMRDAAADSGGTDAGGSERGAERGRAGALGSAGAACDAADGGDCKQRPVAEITRSEVEADTAPAASADDYHLFIQHIDQFGLSLGHELATSDMFAQQNLLYSPLSATYALAMTYAGARGQTETEMKALLGDSFAGTTFHSAANRLARELASRATSRVDAQGKEIKLELNLADALFLERTLSLKPAFLDLLARNYDSGVQRLDFMNAPEPSRLIINDWVAEQTHDRIRNLLSKRNIDAQTRLVLVNALYFYGSWMVPFNPVFTHDADFHALAGDTLQVPTMHMQTQALYASTPDFSVAELAYEGGHVHMTIVLPADGKFESVRGMVSGAWFEQTHASLERQLANIALPKFKMTVGSFSLAAGLQALGMKQAFSGAADFSGMSSGPALSISDVLQKCFIAVDEGGTEAAAATAVTLTGSNAAPPKPVEFVVDRPFLFFIRDDSGAILFSGHVVDPR